MTASTGHRYRKLVRRLAIGLGLVLVVAMGIGFGYETIGSLNDAADHPAPGQLVDVGGLGMHLNCAGEGSPIDRSEVVIAAVKAMLDDLSRSVRPGQGSAAPIQRSVVR